MYHSVGHVLFSWTCIIQFGHVSFSWTCIIQLDIYHPVGRIIPLDIYHSVGHVSSRWTCIIPLGMYHSVGHVSFSWTCIIRWTCIIQLDMYHSVGHASFRWACIIPLDMYHSVPHVSFRSTCITLHSVIKQPIITKLIVLWIEFSVKCTVMILSFWTGRSRQTVQSDQSLHFLPFHLDLHLLDTLLCHKTKLFNF